MGGLPAGTDHRPWPIPRSPWVVAMRWNDLAFLHWRVDPRVLRPLVPDDLRLDTREDTAWVGITPFQMAKVRVRFTPPLPRLSRFPELNLRTYVTTGGKPGIWFFSLDAASELAVQTARRVFGLPYFMASMTVRSRDGDIDYALRRLPSGNPEVAFRASYRPTGPVAPAPPGSLEHWLTERYCLYSLRGRSLIRGEIHHGSWPLQAAQAEVLTNTVGEPSGIALDSTPALVHFSRRLDVVAWLPSRLEV